MMLNGGTSKRFQHFIQQNLACGLVISSGPSSFHTWDMQGRHFEMTMARAYVYNKVRSLLAVFEAFEVLNHEDKKRGKRKTRQWIRRRAISTTSWRNDRRHGGIYKDMMRISHAVIQRILSYIEQDVTRRQVLGGNKVISPKERLALTISHTQNCLALLPSLLPWWP